MSPLRLQTGRLGRLRGKRLLSAEARGKHLLLHFERELALHCHLGMNGSWRIDAPGARRGRSAWVVLSTTHAEAAQFGGTRLALRREGELRSDPRLASLASSLQASGPPPERRPFAWPLSVRHSGKRCSTSGWWPAPAMSTRARAALQHPFDPWRPVSEFTDADLERLFEALQDMMAAGVEGKRRRRLVYRRGGLPCARCGTRIRSRGQGDANRTTYWCPRCQA